jgi:hypothetical protein
MEEGTRGTAASAQTTGAIVRPSAASGAMHWHWGLAVCALVVAITGRSVGVAADTATPPPRVRSSDRALADLIDQAARQSETFRRLVATIQASNGIVYVEPGTCGHFVRACLKLAMQVSGLNRLLHVVIDRQKRDSDVEVMASIGHELQHVIEALSDPSVTDGVKLYFFFRRYAPTGENRFETTTAVDAGDAVYYELRRNAGIAAPSGRRLR